MKPILKHISLLIFSGLILPVCNSISQENTGNTITNKVIPAVKPQTDNPVGECFSFYHDIAGLAFPVLKSLN
ncbi:hypothetical protein [Mucilaginibacter sp.]|jgi:hypothetical protein|uniref:hypothetical protein n=1 Tax=Mucilaginibacter sp. TaxID=1882438 RepID=UPI0035615083